MIAVAEASRRRVTGTCSTLVGSRTVIKNNSPRLGEWRPQRFWLAFNSLFRWRIFQVVENFSECCSTSTDKVSQTPFPSADGKKPACHFLHLLEELPRHLLVAAPLKVCRRQLPHPVGKHLVMVIDYMGYIYRLHTMYVVHS